MNNTFEATYVEYNVSTNQNTTYAYQLDCIGYYLVGIQTTPVPYWENSANYDTAWANSYNSTIADLYQDNAYQTTVRWACDENYNPNNPLTKCEFLKLKDAEVFVPTTTKQTGDGISWLMTRACSWKLPSQPW